MGKKHFIALANEISAIANIQCRIEAARAVARAAKQFNPAFDAAKFYTACDVIILQN